MDLKKMLIDTSMSDEDSFVAGQDPSVAGNEKEIINVESSSPSHEHSENHFLDELKGVSADAVTKKELSQQPINKRQHVPVSNNQTNVLGTPSSKKQILASPVEPPSAHAVITSIAEQLALNRKNASSLPKKLKPESSVAKPSVKLKKSRENTPDAVSVNSKSISVSRSITPTSLDLIDSTAKGTPKILLPASISKKQLTGSKASDGKVSKTTKPKTKKAPSSDVKQKQSLADSVAKVKKPSMKKAQKDGKTAKQVKVQTIATQQLNTTPSLAKSSSTTSLGKPKTPKKSTTSSAKVSASTTKINNNAATKSATLIDSGKTPSKKPNAQAPSLASSQFSAKKTSASLVDPSERLASPQVLVAPRLSNQAQKVSDRQDIAGSKPKNGNGIVVVDIPLYNSESNDYLDENGQVVFNYASLINEYNRKNEVPVKKNLMNELENNDDMEDFAIEEIDAEMNDDDDGDNSDDLDEANVGDSKQDPSKKPSTTKRKSRIGKYDIEDPFIDDTELLWETQRAATKDGFFVFFGPLIEKGHYASFERIDGTMKKGGIRSNK
ncbi:hypothetical protein ACO0QE_003687 [Hanseniaspora vineae]